MKPSACTWVVGATIAFAVHGGCKRHEGVDSHADTTLTAAESPRANNEDSPVADPDVTSAVRRELSLDPAVPAARLDVATRAGIVTVTGTVDNLLAKERVTRHAEMVRGVRVVDNRIDVHPPRVTDSVLARDIDEALHANLATANAGITASAENGIVTLKGTAQSFAEWAAAERVASRTRGVGRVVNQIQIEQATKRADDDIAHDVRERLRWDVGVDAGLVLSKVQDGKVWLGGVVGSAAAKRRATFDAHVAGVKAVDAAAVEVKGWAHRDDLRTDDRPARSDAEIESAIRAAVSYEPRLRETAVLPVVSNGMVTLRGAVETLEAKAAAGDLAKHTVGVLDVDNRIAVTPAQPSSDLQIAKRVTSALAHDPYLGSFGIVAKVSRGTVRLTGTVESPFEKTEAEYVAAGVRGVQNVDNGLDVSNPSGAGAFDPAL